MSNIYGKALLFVVFGSIALASCKKNNDLNKSVNIVGHWALNELGPDSNYNNIVDPGETVLASRHNVSGHFNLNADSTFEMYTNFNGSIESETARYSYSNSVITIFNPPFTGPMRVYDLTNNKLVIKVVIGVPVWYIYTR